MARIRRPRGRTPAGATATTNQVPFIPRILGVVDNGINKGANAVNVSSDLNIAGAVAGRMNTASTINRDITKTHQIIGEVFQQNRAAGSYDREVLARLGKRAMSGYMSAGKNIAGGVKDAGAEYWRWMNTGGLGSKAAKYGATAGAYGAVNYAGRLMSGGGMTYNNDGERDIMGIPFI